MLETRSTPCHKTITITAMINLKVTKMEANQILGRIFWYYDGEVRSRAGTVGCPAM